MMESCSTAMTIESQNPKQLGLIQCGTSNVVNLILRKLRGKAFAFWNLNAVL